MTFRCASASRINTLRMTMDWLSRVPLDLELIVVEQDREPRLQLDDSPYHYPVRHVHAYNPQLFNRSWGFNIAVQHAAGDKLVFADSDIVMPPQRMVEASQYLDRYDAVAPFGRLIDLTEAQTQSLEREPAWTYDWPGETRPGAGFCAGIVMYRRGALARIHGWDERFEGWGCEDQLQWLKTRAALRWYGMRYRAFHLHHERSDASGTDRHGHYAANLALFQRYAGDPGLLLEEMAQTDPGNRDRYRDLGRDDQ